MKPCGIPEIDKENRAIVKAAKLAIASNQKGSMEIVVQKIQDFRIKLAYNKATELLESNFKWTSEYEKILDSLLKLKSIL